MGLRARCQELPLKASQAQLSPAQGQRAEKTAQPRCGAADKSQRARRSRKAQPGTSTALKRAQPKRQQPTRKQAQSRPQLSWKGASARTSGGSSAQQLTGGPSASVRRADSSEQLASSKQAAAPMARASRLPRRGSGNSGSNEDTQSVPKMAPPGASPL